MNPWEKISPLKHPALSVSRYFDLWYLLVYGLDRPLKIRID